MASCQKIQRLDLSSAPTDEFEGQIHPLLIDHVVEKILGYVWNSSDSGKTEVLRNRGVCKIWKEMGSKVYRNSSTTGISLSCENPERGLENFFRTMSQQDELLFSKFTIHHCQISKNPLIFQTFLEKCSPLIHCLEICDEGAFIPLDYFRFQEINLIRLDLTNLKEVCFHKRHFFHCKSPKLEEKGIDGLRVEINVFEAILKASPNIQKFTMDYSSCDELLTDLLPNISKSVQDLRLLDTTRGKNWRNLRTLGLRLTTLEFEVGSNASIESYTNFIDDQKDNLIELKIHTWIHYFTEIPTFPACYNLKVLEVTGSGCEQFLPFMKGFPSLKKLRLSRRDICDSLISEDASDVRLGTPNASVEDLEIHYIIASSALICEFSKLFPKLKKLRILLGAKEEWENILETLSKKVQNLEEVYILYEISLKRRRSYRWMEEHEFKSSSERIGKTIVYHKGRPELRPTEKPN